MGHRPLLERSPHNKSTNTWFNEPGFQRDSKFTQFRSWAENSLEEPSIKTITENKWPNATLFDTTR